MVSNSGSLLLASAFPRKSLARAACAVEFVVLSGRVVEAVAGLAHDLAQSVPRRAWLSPVLNRHRLVWVGTAGNRRDLHLANIAYGAANGFPDLTEGVQVLEFDRYLLDLSRLAHYGKAGTGEQLAQRFLLVRVCARIDPRVLRSAPHILFNACRALQKI